MSTLAEYKETIKLLALSLGTLSLLGYFMPRLFDFGFGLIKREYKAYKLRVFIKKNLAARLKEKIKKQILNGKYIPDTFVEVGEVKEKFRYFCDPSLFIKKEIDRIRLIRLDYLNEKLALAGKEAISLEPPLGIFSAFGKLNRIKVKNLSQTISGFVDEKLKYVQNCDSNLGFMVRYKFEGIINDLGLFHKQVLILTDDAGQGKTNLVCDFVDRFLYRKNIPTVFLLGHEIVSDDIESSILNDIAYQQKEISYLSAKDALNRLAKKRNSPFIIIIDGLNENLNSKVFAYRLERFIEELIKEPNAKLILTCRSDFFKDVFSNISKASFSDQVAYIPSINIKLAQEEREALVRKYFKYFRIRRGHVSGKAIDDLTQNFLLLRIFCEVNSNKTVDILNIYRVDLFKRYLEMKCAAISARVAEYSDIKIDSTFKLKKYLHKIAEFMLENGQFAEMNIGEFITKVNELPEVVLKRFIDESLIFKRDSRAGVGEVFGFTFDEFRDFVIADYLMTLDAARQGKYLGKYLTKGSPIFEGVSRFVYYLARECKSDTLLGYYESQAWFSDFLVSSVFEIPDGLILESDKTVLKRIFLSDVRYSSKIIVNLLIRFDIERYKTLNIHLLFEILSSLTKAEYEAFVFPVFRNQYRDYVQLSVWPIRKFIKELSDILVRHIPDKAFRFHEIFGFLLFLREIGGVSESEVRQLWTKYSRMFPEVSRKHLERWGLGAE